MGFPSWEYWSELPCPPPGDLPDPRIGPAFPALARVFTAETPGKQKSLNPPPAPWTNSTSFSLCVCAKSLQSCLNLCDPMDCSPPGSSVHGILQARILEWVAISSSRGSSWPRDQTCISYVSCMALALAGGLGSLPLVPPGKPPFSTRCSEIQELELHFPLGSDCCSLFYIFPRVNPIMYTKGS